MIANISTSIEQNHKSVETVKKGQAGAGVAIKIEGATQQLFGRHLDEKETLYSLITRHSIDTLKSPAMKDEVTKDEWALIIKLKSVIAQYVSANFIRSSGFRQHLTDENRFVAFFIAQMYSYNSNAENHIYFMVQSCSITTHRPSPSWNNCQRMSQLPYARSLKRSQRPSTTGQEARWTRDSVNS